MFVTEVVWSMESNLLFTAALGLQAPWQVAAIRFEPLAGADSLRSHLRQQPVELPGL